MTTPKSGYSIGSTPKVATTLTILSQSLYLTINDSSTSGKYKGGLHICFLKNVTFKTS